VVWGKKNFGTEVKSGDTRRREGWSAPSWGEPGESAKKNTGAWVTRA